MEARFEDFSSQILLKTKCVHVCLAIFYISYSLQCDKVKKITDLKKKNIYIFRWSIKGFNMAYDTALLLYLVVLKGIW